MSPEAQRIAIAEACGWKFHPESDISTPVESAHPECWTHDEHGKIFNLPDYLNDLNAMHEAEKQCIKGQYTEDRYWRRLKEAFVINNKQPFSINFNLIHTTAAQRAEAFLRTLNLWKQ